MYIIYITSEDLLVYLQILFKLTILKYTSIIINQPQYSYAQSSSSVARTDSTRFFLIPQNLSKKEPKIFSNKFLSFNYNQKKMIEEKILREIRLGDVNSVAFRFSFICSAFEKRDTSAFERVNKRIPTGKLWPPAW